MDSVLHSSIVRLRTGQQEEVLHVDDVIARFIVTKTSWRGRYRRVFAVTRTALITQHPDDLAVTNTYRFVGDSDLVDVRLGGGSGHDQEFILTVRADAKVVLTCPQRTRDAARQIPLQSLGPASFPIALVA